MRKEVRFGLAIGAVLLAVLVVYVLVVPGDPNAQPLTRAEDTQSEVQLEEPTAVASEQPAPAAVDTTNPPAAQVPPAQVPTESTAVPPSRGNETDQWALLLANGPDAVQREASPAETRTPTQTTRTSPPAESTSPEYSPAPTAPSYTNNDTAAVPGAGASDPTPVLRTYTVQPGDTPSSISKAFYGSAIYYPHILRANPGLDPKRMRVGQVINIPAKEDVVPQTAVVQPADATRASSTQSPSHDFDPTRQYRVQDGDSLYRISTKLYGSGKYVQDLYQLNQQLIGPDPAKLKLGMVLALPIPPTVAAR
jgi:nucleoid-associated protein YgaU